LGIPVVPVEDVTSTHQYLRKSKTLHPKFWRYIKRQDNESDVQQMEEFDIPN
jgi:phosphoribosylaminoimidazolecarboxamide formyltransferase/IMP cyclohydrolase